VRRVVGRHILLASGKVGQEEIERLHLFGVGAAFVVSFEPIEHRGPRRAVSTASGLHHLGAERVIDYARLLAERRGYDLLPNVLFPTPHTGVSVGTGFFFISIRRIVMP
jgi:hypothetical protein